MDLAEALKNLWRHKRWVLLGAVLAALAAVVTVYRPTGFPPKLESRSIEVGAASTQLLVDSPDSPLGSLDRAFEPLAARAAVYSRLMRSAPMIKLIAEELDINASGVSAAGPPKGGRGVAPEERNLELLSEGSGLRLFATAEKDLPVITISTQARDAVAATRLADAAARSLRRYIQQLQVLQGVDPTQRVKIRRLGAADGGVVNSGAGMRAAILAALAVFGGVCMLILILTNLRAADEAVPRPMLNANGIVPRPDAVTPPDTAAGQVKATETSKKASRWSWSRSA